MKLSVITVAKNSEKTIAATIESVAAQSHAHVEHIVIDGASTDGTKSIIEKNAKRISRWISEPDKGMYDAMNKGLRMASGSAIGFLNADDVYAGPHVLARIAGVLGEAAIDACYGDLVYVDGGDTGRIVRYWQSSRYRHGLFARGWCPPHPTFYVKKTVVDRCGGFDVGYAIGNDVEFMLRLLARYRIRTAHIPEVLVKMRMGGESNRSLSNVILQNIEILKAARRNRVPVNPLSFLFLKMVSRYRQFHSAPPDETSHPSLNDGER